MHKFLVFHSKQALHLVFINCRNQNYLIISLKNNKDNNEWFLINLSDKVADLRIITMNVDQN